MSPKIARIFREKHHIKNSVKSFARQIREILHIKKTNLPSTPSAASSHSSPNSPGAALLPPQPDQQAHHPPRGDEPNEHGVLDPQENLGVSTTLNPDHVTTEDSYPEDGPEATNAGHSAPTNEREEENAGDYLWDRAFESLDKDMVIKYNLLVDDIVRREVAGAESTNPEEVIPEERNIEPVRASETVSIQTRVERIIQYGKHHLANKRDDQIIGLNARNVLKEFTQVVSFIKPLIDGAVQVSPEASLAWVGVCIILPILTRPFETEEVNVEGLQYISSHMPYYTIFESALQQLQRTV
ncbi:hypothetical protein F5B19DRAFT_492359 [Rostrohypoxylon terebratum]|nr:hypothetical protein F5B19DRAFT_492359 [Rostrohypoxylon terebratum]